MANTESTTTIPQVATTVVVTGSRGQNVVPPHLSDYDGVIPMTTGRTVSWRLPAGIYRIRAYTRVNQTRENRMGDLWERRYTVRVRQGAEADVTIR